MRYCISTEPDLQAWLAAQCEVAERDTPLLVPRIQALRAAALLDGEDRIAGIARFLRPWDLDEWGWIGGEITRAFAQQALCWLGRRDPGVRDELLRLAMSHEQQWVWYDEQVRYKWEQWTDCSCMTDPHNDFRRCIREVIECIDRGRDE
jgi:hypothetical protein